MSEGLNENQSILQEPSMTINRPHISADTIKEVFKDEESEFLSSGFGLLGVSKDKDGKYTIRFPGLKNNETGSYLGVSYYKTDDYLDAKNFYVKQSKELESINSGNILSFNVDNTNIIFSGIDNFNPQVAIQEVPIECSSEITELLHSDRPDTFVNTINTKEWQIKLFDFTKDYISSNEDIQKLISNNKIDLYHLSPKQAINIVTTMVVNLTKFNGEWQKNGSQADNSTVIQLLEEGSRNKNNPDWKGNGVCRNFSSFTKALFDAIKSNQGKYNLLENTHCVIRTGERRDYDPGYAKANFTVGGDGGHAWNDFIQVSHNGLSSNITTVDVTWASRDLESKKIVNLDQTLKRMERSFQTLAKKIPDNEQGIPELNKILSYYDLMIKNSKETATGRHHYAKSVLYLLKGRDTSQFDSETLEKVKSVAWVYLSDQAKTMERDELEILYGLSLKQDNNIDGIIEKYMLRNKSDLLFKSQTRELVFNNPDLQSKINQKLHEIGKFDDVLKNNRYFREHLAKQTTGSIS